MNRGQMIEAEQAARVIQATLAQRGLRPLFSDWLLTEDHGLTWLFGVLDEAHRAARGFYQADLLHTSARRYTGSTCLSATAALALRRAAEPSATCRRTWTSRIERAAALGIGAGGGEIEHCGTGGALLVAGRPARANPYCCGWRCTGARRRRAAPPGDGRRDIPDAG